MEQVKRKKRSRQEWIEIVKECPKDPQAARSGVKNIIYSTKHIGLQYASLGGQVVLKIMQRKSRELMKNGLGSSGNARKAVGL